MGRSSTVWTYLCLSHVAQALYIRCIRACYVLQSISPAMSPVEGGYPSGSSNAIVPPGTGMLGNRGHEAWVNSSIKMGSEAGTDDIPTCECR